VDERTGRSAARRALRGRRAGLLTRCAAALLAGGAIAASAASPALADRPAYLSASSEYPATVDIDTVTPRVTNETSTVHIAGKVTNSGKSTLKGAYAAVRGPSGSQAKLLSTRSEIALVAGRSSPTGQDGVDLANPRSDLKALGPGESAAFVLDVPVADLKLKTAGVYELAVDVWGTTSDSEKSHPLGIGRTFLPYTTGASAKPSQVSVIWPITHTPELVAQTMPDDDQTPVLRDDSLVTDLAPGGRLHQLVEIGAEMPGLTWVIDPDLLDTVYAMTKPYRVQKPGTGGDSARADNTVAGTGKEVATAWLDGLRRAVARSGDQVVSLPYADPDLASIAHNGTGLAGMDTALRKAVTAGQVTTEARLSVDVTSDVAWPYQGWLDQRIAATAGAAGGRVLLVNGASMPENELPYTPGAARPIGNGQTAVVADATVSALFQGDLAGKEAQTAAEQRFLAETLAFTLQDKELQRGLLVMPPRSLTVGTATALSAAMKEAQAGGWINQATLNTVASAAADHDANGSVPADYSRELAGSELSPAALAQAMEVQDGLDQLMLILTQPQRVRGPFSAAMVRSMSTEWRDQPKAGAEYRVGVREYLKNLRSAVKILPKSMVTLPGDNATLLVSVKNDLTQAVGNLELRLSSSQTNRLKVGDKQAVVLDATTSRTFRFYAEAQVNGPVQVTAQLWTTGPNPQRYGDPVTFTVEVTSVASGVLYVIGGGVVLMALAGIRFYLQRKKRTEAGSDEDPERLLDDPPAPEAAGQGADAEPRTAADDADRVAGDEKVDHQAGPPRGAHF